MQKRNLVGMILGAGLLAWSSVSLVAVADDDDHPRMEKALHALQNAKDELEHSKHDFQGHRLRALEMTNQAINEVQSGLRPDRNRRRDR